MVPAPRLFWIASIGLAVAALPLVVHPLAWTLVAAMWAALGAALLVDGAALLLGRPRVGALVPDVIGVGDSARVPVASRSPGRPRWA